MVETEVRETMVKSFEKMPSDYWNTPQSLSKVSTDRFLDNLMYSWSFCRFSLKLLGEAEELLGKLNPPTM